MYLNTKLLDWKVTLSKNEFRTHHGRANPQSLWWQWASIGAFLMREIHSDCWAQHFLTGMFLQVAQLVRLFTKQLKHPEHKKKNRVLFQQIIDRIATVDETCKGSENFLVLKSQVQRVEQQVRALLLSNKIECCSARASTGTSLGSKHEQNWTKMFLLQQLCTCYVKRRTQVYFAKLDLRITSGLSYNYNSLNYKDRPEIDCTCDCTHSTLAGS